MSYPYITVLTTGAPFVTTEYATVDKFVEAMRAAGRRAADDEPAMVRVSGGYDAVSVNVAHIVGVVRGDWS